MRRAGSDAAAGRRLGLRSAGRLAAAPLAGLVALLAIVAVVAGARPLARRLVRGAAKACDGGSPAAGLSRLAWAARLGGAKPEIALAAARCALRQGDYRAAERHLTAFAGTTGPASAAGRALGQVALLESQVAYAANRPAEARERADAALTTAARIGDRALEAAALVALARSRYYSTGEGEPARRDLERARLLAQGVGDPEIEADALRHLGVIAWWYDRDAEEAIERFYLPALELYERAGRPQGAATTLTDLALAEEARGDFRAAIALHERAIAGHRAIGDRGGEAESLYFFARTVEFLGAGRRAHRSFRSALTLARTSGYRLIEIEADYALGWLEVARGELDAAIELFEESLARHPEEPWLRRMRVGGLGYVHWQRGDLEKAIELYERTIELGRSAGARDGEWGYLMHLATLHRLRGDAERGRRLFAEALEQYAQVSARSPLDVWGHFSNRSEYQLAAGDRDSALAGLLQAAEVESRLLGGRDSPAFASENRRLYERLLPLLFADSAPGAEARAFDLLERLRYRPLKRLVASLSPERARSVDTPPTLSLPALERASERFFVARDTASWRTIELAYAAYEQRMLAALLSPRGHALLERARPAELETVQRALGSDAALVYFQPVADETGILVVTRDRIAKHSVPIGRERLADKVRLFESLLRRSPARADWRTIARDLHEHLIAPIERRGWLAGVTRLGLLPAGPLRDLSWPALLGSRPDGPFLIQDYALFFPPSASFLLRPAAPRSRSAPVLVLGLREGPAGMPPLEAAEREARDVAALYGSQPRLGRSASEAAFKREAPSARRVHIASHGVAEPELPLLSRLLLSPDLDDDGALTVGELLNLELTAELVVLGACRTGIAPSAGGAEGAEADRIGFFEALLATGAHAVVASVAPVDDAAATELLLAFHREALGGDLTGALARAQRAAAKRGVPPREWASFRLAGAAP